MSLLTRAIANVKAHNTVRPPVGSGGLSGFGGSISGTGNQTTMLSTLGTSSWLFATIDRIATAVSATEWKLFTKTPGGDKREVEDGVLHQLWQSPNPFYVREEFLELSVQHFSLVGEMWWVIVRDGMGMGIPVELWPVRPDRMQPIPSPTEVIAGYRYRVGTEVIDLDTEDVIFMRRPSPIDAFRGIGVIGSLLFDMGADKAAAQWTANFFGNSALPGGVIETEDSLSDAEFETMSLRWRTQHQGVQNAHRVAILEKAKWKDRAFSQRDMQFEQLRKLNRDVILGGFGMPPSLLGIAENVNRANAEAAEVMFARWIVVPMLRRLQAGVNARLVPQFDDRATFEFVDPTPDNREQDLREAVEGYKAGVLMLNESRELLDREAVPDGDEFFTQPAPASFGLLLEDPATVRKALVAKNPLHPDEVDDEETRMVRSWRARFAIEVDALVAFLDQFKARSKIEPTDLDAYDWDWWLKYGDDVVAELEETFVQSMLAVFPDAPPAVVQRLAADWATERGAQLLRLDGEFSVTQATRTRVNELVAGTIERGDSLGALQRQLRDDPIFSRSRAERVARTETATALGQGQRGAATALGHDEKRWVTQGDDRVNQPICATNELQGWIKFVDGFQSGHETIPGHVNCRCTVLYRTAAPEERTVKDVRCPRCGKALPVHNFSGIADVYCKRCDLVFTAESAMSDVIN